MKAPFQLVLAALALTLTAAGCSAESGPVGLVDGVEISADSFDALHADSSDLDPDGRAGSALLLILRSAFLAEAEEQFDQILDDDAVDAAFEARVETDRARGDLDKVLADRNQTRNRVRIEAELDVLRELVGAHLVISESAGFDIAAAYEAYLLRHAEVCVQQITLASAEDYEPAVARLAVGESFEDLAREISVDPFVDREEGSGAGGLLGCSAPEALPVGLATATLEAPIGEPFGPVASTLGTHLLLVYERTTPDLADVRDDVLEAAVPVQGDELFNRWAVGVLQDTEVTVDESYGRWGRLPETGDVPTVVPTNAFDRMVSE